MAKNILIIAAHPDDEALGCSGTIAKYVTSGCKVHVAFMTDGISSRNSSVTCNVDAKVRKKASHKAAKILGVSSTRYFDFPDNKMDTVALLDIVQSVEDLLREIEPEIVYTHHIGDLNIDHQVTHKATMTACRPQPGFCVKEIFAFEVLSSTEWSLSPVSAFNPKKFVDISATLDRKLNAIDEYSDEMRDFPHARSKDAVLYLAKLRGSSIGVEAAEAFQVERLLT